MTSWQRKAQRPVPPLGLPLWCGQKTWRRKNPERARCEGEGTGKLWVTRGNVKGKPCSFLLATSHLFLCIWGRDMLGIPDIILMKGPSWFPQKQQEPSAWSPSSPHSHIPEQQPDVFLGPRQPTRMTTSRSGGGFPNPCGRLSPQPLPTSHGRSCSWLWSSLRTAPSVAFSTNAPFTCLPEKSLEVEICSHISLPTTHQGHPPAWGGRTPALAWLTRALHTLSCLEAHLPPSLPGLQPKPPHADLPSIRGAQCTLPMLPSHMQCPLSGMPFSSASGRQFGYPVEFGPDLFSW